MINYNERDMEYRIYFLVYLKSVTVKIKVMLFSIFHLKLEICSNFTTYIV